MNEKRLFDFLKQQPSSALLDLIQRAYREMTTNQRHAVFGSVVKQMPPSSVNGSELLKRIKMFHSDSLAGKYYAPFEINSKNFSHIPEETEEWFEILGDLLKDSTRLSEQNEHPLASECFNFLYGLIEHMENDEGIVFADELGSWMIPGDEKKFIAAYLSSLASVATSEAFTTTVIPLIRDGIQSFSGNVYRTAIKVASKEQSVQLNSEIKHQNIRTGLKN